MILLKNEIKKVSKISAESIKLNCIYDLYKDIALFWTQNDNQATICMLDGNMIICNHSANIDELREFINVISPLSVFSDADTLTALFNENFHRVCVVKSDSKFKCDTKSDTVTSKEIYSLLDVSGLNLPPYEHFAVDFCYRLNHGQLKYFAQKQNCAAIGISDGQAVLLNGIASHKRGMGTFALYGLLSQYALPYIAVCEKEVLPFYLKNNFSHFYDAGYWRKKLELL